MAGKRQNCRDRAPLKVRYIKAKENLRHCIFWFSTRRVFSCKSLENQRKVNLGLVVFNYLSLSDSVTGGSGVTSFKFGFSKFVFVSLELLHPLDSVLLI